MFNEHIVSIQSQVCDGFCGNNVAIFVLRRRGHAPKFVNTVQYYSKFKHVGVEIRPEELKIIINEISAKIRSLDNTYSIQFLTGYIRTKECVEIVINNILNLKKEKKAFLKEETLKKDNYLIENLINLNFFWICDPVMGDNERLYVDDGVVNAYKQLVHFADIITPNKYELELLCDTKIHEEKDVTNSLNFLLNKGVKIVILTSVDYAFDKDNLYLYIGFLNNQNKLVCFRYKFIKYPFIMCGTGDLFSSLLLSFIIKKKGNILDIISKVLNIINNVVKSSLNSNDLHIIENQDIIAGDGTSDNIIKGEEILKIKIKKMSYGWLTESTFFKKKEEIIELNKDKLSNENKNNKKNENSIDKLNNIVNSYLHNIKEKKKNPVGKKKINYYERLYNARNEGVEKRNEQDKNSLSLKKKINKKEMYEEMKKKGSNNPNYLVDFESRKKVELELEEIRKLKEKKIRKL